MNNLFKKIAGLSIGLAMAIGVGVAVSNNREAEPVHAVETSAYKMTTVQSSSNTAYASYYNNITIGTKTWNAPGNQNFSGYWRIGGKKANNDTNISRYLQCNTAFSENITKVTLSHGGFSRTGISISGATLTIASDAAFSQNVQTSSITPSVELQTAGSFSFENASGWGTGKYYKIDLTMANSTTNNGGLDVKSIEFFYNASTPLTGITLSGTEVGGTSPDYTLSSIAKSDTTTNHTVSVGLTPNTATDQKVKVEHYDGDNVVDIYSSPVTCTSGTGSFNVRAKGTAVGTERLKIYGNTETSVFRYLSVTVYDDSVTNWTVSFDSDGGAAIADMIVEDGDTFEFPSPGTKEHYTFDGWSADGENFYDEGDTSPVVKNDIEYTAYWTEDSKYTVTYVHGDHGTGDDYVVNNVYAGSYTLATFATAGFEASSGYSFKKWSVGGVEYAEDASITVSAPTTVTAIYKAVDEYILYTSALVEGDYVLTHEGSDALTNTITSNRADVTSVTPVNNKITDPDASIIWTAESHEENSETYWTFYNAAVDKYLSTTGSNNQCRLDSDYSANNARWTVTLDEGVFAIVNNSNSRYLRDNTGVSPHGFGCYADSTGKNLTLYKAPSNELSSIALSGDYKTSFASGETFSFGGTVTASYTKDDPANVTSSTTFHLDSPNGTNMSGVTMTHAAHDGHTIYAKYTEGDITKTATYSISVSNAPVSNVTINVHAAEIGLNKTYSVSSVTPTVLPDDAVQTTEWVVSANTVSDDYTWDGTTLTSKNTAGSITLRCRSTVDNSKYDELVVTVTGDPTATFDVRSYTGYVSETIINIDFTYANIEQGQMFQRFKTNSSDGSVAFLYGTRFDEINKTGYIQIILRGAGNATLTLSYDDVLLDSIPVTSRANNVEEVNWSASNIDVFSGATLTSDIDSTWNVNYRMSSGETGNLSYGEYTLKLGGSSITLPHTWVADDDGKTLCVEYGGTSSSTVSVTVTQTINSVNAPVPGEPVTSTLTFTAACGGSGTSDGGEKWTVTSDGTESNFDTTKGIHYGTSSGAVQYIKLTTSDFASGTITKIVVNASTASGVSATAGVTVGGKAFGGNPQSLSSSAAEYTFNGEADAGEIIVTITKPSSATKAIYCKSIAVTYVTESGDTINIANDPSHKAAQRVAVKFAKAFNEAMSGENVCSGTYEAMESAWETAESAYNTFKNEAAALGETEETWAKNLIKYANIQWSDDSGEACIERMLKTYQVCVNIHGMTPFMSELRSVKESRVSPLSTIVNNGNTIAIVVAVSMISLAAIGGYFFLRRRKED